MTVEAEVVREGHNVRRVDLVRRRLVVGILIGPATLVAVEPRFSFAMPAGFVSLKDSARIPELGDREPKFRAEASTTDAYAVRLKNDVAVVFAVAKIYAGGAPLRTWKQYLKGSVAKTRFANDAIIGPAHPIWVGGVECAFADVERVTDGVAFRERYYVLPGGDHWAFVKLLATAEEFASAAPTVADAVAATRGVAPSTLDEPICLEIQRATLFGIGVAVLSTVLLVSWVKRSAARRKRVLPSEM